MARTSELEEFFAYLTDKPWWVSVTMGATVFVVIKYGIPLLPIDWGLFQPVIDVGSWIFCWFGLFFLIPAFGSVARAFRDRRLLEVNDSIRTVRELDWQTFEILIEAHYRQLGYRVERQRKGGPDGGVDVRITNEEGKRFLVQCKHWRAQQVGVKIVRELLGVVTSERATGGIVITSGAFTLDAYEFAKDVAIELIDGDRLHHMLGDRLADINATKTEKKADSSAAETCPLCGSELVVQTARRGLNPGSRFYGCSAYPDCRFTKDLNR